MHRDFKVIRLRDRELGEHTLVVSKSWGRYPEVLDVIARFEPSDRGIQKAHEYIVDVSGRAHDLRDNGIT